MATEGNKYSPTDNLPYTPHQKSISSQGIDCQCKIGWRSLYDILVLILLLYCTIVTSYLLHQYISQSCLCQYSSLSTTGDNSGT